MIEGDTVPLERDGTFVMGIHHSCDEPVPEGTV